jgi:hypothetical protein
MKPLCAYLACAALVHALLVGEAGAQSLPGSLGFSLGGSFQNAVADGSNSVMLTDNDLTNGYRYGFDLQDAPDSLSPNGPAGAAAFQWGTISSSSDYPHTSALWFEPLAVSSVLPEQSFEIGYLYYRNGTIRANTGATAVDLDLTLTFAPSLNQSPITLTYRYELINTPNNKYDPVDSADIVRFDQSAFQTSFTDPSGKAYFLQLAFEIDQDTLDGTLSTPEQFHVFEGGQGRATLTGTFTTLGATIPEPSSTLLAGLGGILLLCHRRRQA